MAEDATNPAIVAVLDHVIADKERHAAFGWLYLRSRAPHWTPRGARLIAEEITAHVRDTELKGYHCPWLAPEHAAAEAEADALTAAAGLGAASRAAEEDALVRYVGNARRGLPNSASPCRCSRPTACGRSDAPCSGAAFLQLLVAGIGTGSIYALIALGFNVVFKSTGAMNFAQGEWVVMGGMISPLCFRQHQQCRVCLPARGVAGGDLRLPLRAAGDLAAAPADALLITLSASGLPSARAAW